METPHLTADPNAVPLECRAAIAPRFQPSDTSVDKTQVGATEAVAEKDDDVNQMTSNAHTTNEVFVGQRWVNRTRPTNMTVVAADDSLPGRWWVRLLASGLLVSLSDLEVQEHTRQRSVKRVRQDRPIYTAAIADRGS